MKSMAMHDYSGSGRMDGSRLIFYVFAAVMFLASPAAAQPSGQKGGPPPAVVVETIVEKNVNPATEYVGRVEALQSVDIQARVQGFLEEVRFKEGAYVHTGDVLYLIEQAPYDAQVNVDKAKVAQAQAALTKAAKYLKRLKTVQTGGVSASDLETAVSEAAEANAALQQAQATLAQAELNLGYTTIAAPIDGRIGKTMLTKGNVVGSTSGVLARIVQLDPIRVVFSISETKLPEIQNERLSLTKDNLNQTQNFTLKLPGGELYPYKGTPEFVDNEVDTSTGTVAVRVIFENPDGFLLPGQYVTVLHNGKQADRKPMVPQDAVLEDREGRYVFVVDADNKVIQRKIETGSVVDGSWIVESGLTAGETIIVQGVQKVAPGQVVNPQTGE